MQEKTHNLVVPKSRVQEAVAGVEDKFGKFWPRNILILFGAPGEFCFAAGVQ